MTNPQAPRPFDDELHDPQPVLPGVVGSISFAPDKGDPKHCSSCVTMEQEVLRLRRGNRELLDANNHLQARIAMLEGRVK